MNGDKANVERAKHWEGVYTEKGEREVSWFEEEPAVSLGLIERCAREMCGVGREANAEMWRELRVTDVGGGSSILARRLAERECEVRVMDISSAAIERGKARAGECGERVQWMVGDVTRVDELPACDVWHDRAAFHFLTSEADRARYVRLAERTVREDGYLIVGTFADDGPERCSGLMVERYGEEQLRKVFANGFEVVEMKRAGHMTPWGKEQRFLWGVFRRGR